MHGPSNQYLLSIAARLARACLITRFFSLAPD